MFPVWEGEKHWGNMRARAMNVSGKASRFVDVY